jgi:drug/metabolite transporter (DMT)-like permease
LSDSATRREGVDRPAVPPALVLMAAVLAVSWAGPLIRFATAPALVVATWRLLFSVAMIALILIVRRGVPRPRLRGSEWLLAAAAGALLAGHFWSWIASLSYTSVASSVVLVSMQPLFVGVLSAVFLGERPGRAQWTGIGLATGGAVVIGWGDFAAGPEALFGDFLAILGALLVSGYYIIGRRLRQQMELWWYVGVVYGMAALVLLVAVLLQPGTALTGYPTTDWLVFLALAAGPMMIGHTGVNYALRYVPAYVVNLAILGEPVGATVIAWALPAIREVPPPQVLAGAVLILGGIAVATVGGRRAARIGRNRQAEVSGSHGGDG